MRAIIFNEHSPSLDVYQYTEDMPIPEPGPEQVLIEVHYAAINRLDNWVRHGWKGLNLDFPHIPCSDFSGVIVKTGERVENWQPGQRVTANPLMWHGEDRFILRGEHNLSPTWHILGENIRGACAEYVAVPARNLIAIPEDYDMRKAAAASLVYVTAWHSLMVAGDLRATEKVLIVGAGGGVNTASIQISKLAGAEVFVIASDAKKAERAREQGADWVHDRSTEDNWSKAVYLATGKEGVDVVVDNVGEATWQKSLRCLRNGGRLLTVGGTSGYNAVVPVNMMFGKHLRIIGSTMGSQFDYRTVMTQVFQGKLDPVIDRVFPMQEFRAAMEHMLANEHFGKILLQVKE